MAAGTADGKYLALGPVTILSWMLRQLKPISEEVVVLMPPAPGREGFFPVFFPLWDGNHERYAIFQLYTNNEVEYFYPPGRRFESCWAHPAYIHRCWVIKGVGG